MSRVSDTLNHLKIIYVLSSLLTTRGCLVACSTASIAARTSATSLRVYAASSRYPYELHGLQIADRAQCPRRRGVAQIVKAEILDPGGGERACPFLATAVQRERIALAFVLQ
jgi:hypothetical protein